MGKQTMIEIRILEKHIRSGIRGSCKSCPVALAAKEKTGSTWFVTGVTMTNISKCEAGPPGDGELYLSHLSIPLPQFVRESIRRFDRGETVEPFSFSIEI